MPDPLRQATALALLDGEPAGPLIVRWSLHGGFKYEQAKAKYEPFDQLVDEDPATRAVTRRTGRALRAGRPAGGDRDQQQGGRLGAAQLCRAGAAIIEAYARIAHEHEHDDHEPAPSEENEQPPGSDA